MTPADESTLVERARAGDVRAYERLFRDHHVRIHNLVAYVIGDRTEAEDVTQRAFVKAYNELPRLREAKAFAPWLNRIATNLAHDAARAQQRRGEQFGADERLEMERADDAAPDAAAAEHERDRTIHAAIAALPEHHREVVLRHHIMGEPVAEIARALGVAQGTVLSRLARARDTLRRKLTPYIEQG